MSKKNAFVHTNLPASEFDGGLLGLIGTSILVILALIAAMLLPVALAIAAYMLFPEDLGETALLAVYTVVGVFTLFSLLFGLAWGNVIAYKWEVRHCKIHGKRLVLDASAWSLFGNWIKWFFLTVVTLGIYGLWLGIKLRKWLLAHVKYAEPVESAPAQQSACPQPPTGNPYLPPMPPMPMQPMQQPAPMPMQQPYGYPQFPFYPPVPQQYMPPQNDGQNKQ